MLSKHYAHYCRKCEKYLACSHEDPEQVMAVCPLCKSALCLQYKSLAALQKELRLSQNEVSLEVVTYV